jgi:hypothetical protein
MRYKFRNGNNFGVDAQVAGETFAAIAARNDGHVPTREVIDLARPPDAPLHGAFEWDDGIAGESFRMEQAQRLIRSVVRFRTVDDAPETPATIQSYYATGDKDVGSRYTSAPVALVRPELRERVIRDAVAQLTGWRNRFGHLQELARIVGVIDEDLRDLA